MKCAQCGKGAGIRHYRFAKASREWTLAMPLCEACAKTATKGSAYVEIWSERRFRLWFLIYGIGAAVMLAVTATMALTTPLDGPSKLYAASVALAGILAGTLAINTARRYGF